MAGDNSGTRSLSKCIENICDFVLLTLIEWEDWCGWDQFLLRKILFRSLMRKGARRNWTDVDGWIHMHFLCKLLNDDDKVDEFFENTYGSNQLAMINAVDRSGWTPLHWAVFLNDKIFAKLLLRKGANPNVADKNGQTPLHIISKRLDDDDFVEKFFEITAGTDRSVQIDALDRKGWTPLRWAKRCKHVKVARALMGRGASLRLIFRQQLKEWGFGWKTCLLWLVFICLLIHHFLTWEDPETMLERRLSAPVKFEVPHGNASELRWCNAFDDACVYRRPRD